MRLAAIIVVYDPNFDDLIRNILSLIDHVDKVLLYQNSLIREGTFGVLSEYLDIGKLILLGDGKNLGIATALNRGVEWSILNNITHIMTLDQDSYFEKDLLASYLDYVEANNDNSVGVFGVNPVCHGKIDFPMDNVYLEVPDTISSGSIIALHTFELCGLFADQLFIDAVDYEFCYRIKEQYGLKTVIITPALMQHEVGYSKKTAFGFSTVNYSAFRSYYILRNQIAIWKKFPNSFQNKYKLTLIKDHFFLRIVKILLAENDKVAKIKAIATGIYHGLIGKSGYYKK